MKLYLPEDARQLENILAAFSFPTPPVAAVHYGCGHINQTYCVLCQPPEGDCVRYILQGLSQTAFQAPAAVMENFEMITSHLRQKLTASGEDASRRTLTLIPTKDGKAFYTDETGRVWRLMPFVEGTDCYQKATPELFAASARAFGKFQYLLHDFPAETLHETIKCFHDTEDRFRIFSAALSEDRADRAKEVAAEIEFVLAREKDCSVLQTALRDGILPLRVTHNDTKLNNVLFDRTTGEGICVIDLDTAMPGLSVNDFGDSIRFGANHSAEDEKDLSKVNFDIELYRVYAKNYIEGCCGILTEAELAYLPWGARLMTLECGIRFLTDYLSGDTYFRIHYPQQNLDRCRTQFKLVQDMEMQFDEMQSCIREIIGTEGSTKNGTA